MNRIYYITGVANGVLNVGNAFAPAHQNHQRLLGPALNVTVRAGEEALLTCVAPHLADKTVEYIFAFMHGRVLIFR